MKMRSGFVSNSSSTCFILDRRNEKTQKLLRKVGGEAPKPRSRSTALAIGLNVKRYAESLDDRYNSEMIARLLRWGDELGWENVVFLRESDEGAGGYLFAKGAFINNDRNRPVEPKEGICWGDTKAYRLVSEVALDEWEYD
jgi:hypothetical protein